MKIFRTLFLFLFIPVIVSGSNPDSTSVYANPETLHKGRLAGVLALQGAVYLGSLSGLYVAWYKDYDHSSFHFFNDNDEWMQMDKAGHMTTTYNISRIGYEMYRWAGVSEKTSTLVGGTLGLAYLINIEILDGFSAEWGFSGGDFIANTTGCLLFVSQQLLWHDQKFTLKYSYHPTKYPQYRPNVLGVDHLQRTFKDYNGQTYWLSGNISSVFPCGPRFPKWLNFSIGYSAEGMTGARGSGNEVVSTPDFEKYRQFFLSLDVDLSRIKTRNQTLHSILTILNFIKIPFPAIEYNTTGHFRLHPLYF